MTSGYSSLEMSPIVERVEKAILSLPERQRDVIKMKYLWVNMHDRSRAKKIHMNYHAFRRDLDHARWYIKGVIDQ